MEPNKLENQIKSTLNARTIQPSDQSWERLDAMLTRSEEKKSKRVYGWFFIAASIILFFGMGFFLFNSIETTKGNDSIPVVITVNEEMDSVETNEIYQISVEKVPPVLVQNEVYNSQKQSRFIQSVEKNELIKEKNLIQENPIATTQPPTPNAYKYVSPADLVAEVQKGNKVITSDKKTIARPRVQVDANSLLTTVEKELDNTYRETTLDKLTRKFQDTKLALANRNYE